MASISGRLRSTGQTPPMPPPKPRHLRQPFLSTVRPGPGAVFSKYLMNDIPRGTSRASLINCLQPASDTEDDSNVMPAIRRPEVHCGCIITDSRLDDELSVAVIEFSNTPKWLQYLNKDLYGFPKKTALGTLWRGVDTGTGEIDGHGRSEFIRATIEGNLIYAETLAEFKDTDVNVQDEQGRTALHWACVENQIDLVRLCLSIPECDIGLRDKDNLTACDIAPADTRMLIPNLFYKSMLDMDESHPETALLRLLTVTSEPAEGKAIFPGEAIFRPIESSNKPLVKALISRGIDLTARDTSGDTALHVAVKVTNVEFAIRLLNAGSDVDAIGEGGATPLHYATSEKRMVQALLSWDANPDTRNDQGMSALDLAKDPEMVRQEMNRKVNDRECLTPLLRAAEDGDSEVVRLLLELGASVDEETTASGQTPLMVAARMGHRDVGELLVEAGADIEATDKSGRTSLDWALTQGFSRLLEDCGAMVAGVNDTERTQALFAGVTDMNTATNMTVEDYMAYGVGKKIRTIEADGEITSGVGEASEDDGRVRRLLSGVQLESNLGLLHAATRDGDLAKIRLLLASGIDIEQRDEDDRTPLSIAAGNGHTEIVQALLASGAQIEAAHSSGATPLYIAAQYGHTETVQALLASGAQIEAARLSGVTPLFIAAQNGHTETVQALLASGAQIEHWTRWAGAPLYIAAQNGHTETVQALLVSGAQIESTKSWATPLFIAAQNGHTETVQALLVSGAQIEAVRPSGATPLYIAAKNGHTETVQALLVSGAQIESTESWATPLFIAAQNGHTETVQALLASGAQIEAVRPSGATPLFTAAQNGHTETVQALLASGAQIEHWTSWGGTPLYIAAQNGHTETVQALLASGAQIEAARLSGATPLFTAAQNGHTETVQALLASGAQIEHATRWGETPLFIATLLAGGADPKAKGLTGETVVNLATSSNREEPAKVPRAARGWRPRDLTAWAKRRTR